MSRRDKQADLRRRMAEARSKLVSSQSNNNDDRISSESDQPSQIAAAGKKRPLPSSTGGGGGGILRKSKYSPSATSEAAAPLPSTARESATDGEAKDRSDDRDRGGPKNNDDNALGSLMVGYDDSSSDDEGEKNVSRPADSVAAIHQRSAPAALPSASDPDVHGVEIIGAKRKRKKSKKRGDAVTDDGTTDAPRRGARMETSLRQSSQETNDESAETSHATKGGNGKAAEISDEVWDEFNSLLEDDETEAEARAAKGPGNEERPKPEADAAPLLEIPAADPATKKSKEKKKKKKNKKKKGDGSAREKDVYDNEAIADVEQASYEARSARMRLWKGRKMRRSGGDDDDDAENEFYDPGLAFQRDDDDEEEEEEENAPGTGGEAAVGEYDGTKSPSDVERGGGGASSSSSAKGTQLSNADVAPRVSLARILRDRRDEARKLSSHAGNESDPEEDREASDGCWF